MKDARHSKDICGGNGSHTNQKPLSFSLSLAYKSLKLTYCLKSKIKERGLTSPAPALSTALMKDMMAVFRFTSSLYRPKLRSSSFSRV